MIYTERGREQESFIAFAEQALGVLAKEAYPSFLSLFDSSRLDEHDLLLALRYLDEGSPVTKIDDPAQVKGDKRDIYFAPFKDGSGFHLDYGLTTDGELNDLTIQMDFLKKGDGYTVTLDDLHTM